MNKQNLKDQGISAVFGAGAGAVAVGAAVAVAVAGAGAVGAVVAVAVAAVAGVAGVVAEELSSEFKPVTFLVAATSTAVAITAIVFNSLSNLDDYTPPACDGAVLEMSDDGTTVTPKLPAGCVLAYK